MSDDSKRNSSKGKSDGMEQRERRQGRQHASPHEKKVEKSPEVLEDAESEKQEFEPPGLEFYPGLKGETDEMLKLTEESNGKYKNKEIKNNWAKYEMIMETYDEKEEQERFEMSKLTEESNGKYKNKEIKNNWAKYEMIMETYDEIEEQERFEMSKLTEESNVKYKNKKIKNNWAKYVMIMERYHEKEEQESYGADFEALLQASVSVGRDYQFEHERSWYTTPGPNPFKEYFDIDSKNVYAALMTVPFYERNQLDLSLFSESEIKSMDDKATKCKQEYDKRCPTPDLETQEKIFKILASDITEHSYVAGIEEYKPYVNYFDENDLRSIRDYFRNKIDINQEAETTSEKEKNDEDDKMSNDDGDNDNRMLNDDGDNDNRMLNDDGDDDDDDDDDDDFYFIQKDRFADEDKDEVKAGTSSNQVYTLQREINLPAVAKKDSTNIPKEPPKIVTDESPEDLEKWLDEFLDS